MVDALDSGETAEAVELTPFYYRDNFAGLLDTVEAQYGDLLEPGELKFLNDWRALPHRAQCLYVRLVSRVGPSFRCDKLSYDELGELDEALASLLGVGLLQELHALDIDTLARLYTLPELRSVFGADPGVSKSDGKVLLVQAIDSLGLTDAALFHKLQNAIPAMLVEPCEWQVVDLFQLLFFGNRYQGLTDFVLSDLGVARYYPYRLDRSERLFPDREAITEYVGCAALSDCYEELLAQGDVDALAELAQLIIQTSMHYSSSQYRWQRLCNELGRSLERHQLWDLALQVYARSAMHPSRERQARIYEVTGLLEEALATCHSIARQPLCEEEIEAADRIRARVQRKMGGDAVKKPGHSFPRMDIQLAAGSDRVELAVAKHLQRDWAEVIYVENQLHNSLFGLAFWEQIFAPVEGVFHNPFQASPTDMFTPQFRARREAQLEQRLEWLGRCDLAGELSAAYRRYHPFQCSWVHWRHITLQLLERVLRVLPAQHLIGIWRRMLFDPRVNRSGFPDLIAIGQEMGEYQLIEVKGPGDALQDSQKRWLRYFASIDVPHSVAWVTWIDS